MSWEIKIYIFFKGMYITIKHCCDPYIPTYPMYTYIGKKKTWKYFIGQYQLELLYCRIPSFSTLYTIKHQKEKLGNSSSKTLIYTRTTKTIPWIFTERHSPKGDQITEAELINTLIEQPERFYVCRSQRALLHLDCYFKGPNLWS